MITDQSSAAHLISANWSKFYLYVAEVPIQSWYSDQENSVPFADPKWYFQGIRMNLLYMFLNSFVNSLFDIVLMDSDIIVLRNIHEVFEMYPKFDIGFTLSPSFFTKQNPNYFINTGVIFIRRVSVNVSAKLFDNILKYMRSDEPVVKKAKVLDQAAVFYFLRKYCVGGQECEFFGRPLVGECISVKSSVNESIPLQVLFLGSEFNSIAIKMYKESYVAHFNGNRKPLMKSRGDFFLKHGAGPFLQKYAKRVRDKNAVSPRATWCDNVQ